MIFLRYKTGLIVRKVEGFLMLLFVSVALTGFAFAQQKAQTASTQSAAGSEKNSTGASAATKAASAKKVVENSEALGPQKLPLRRVVLYKSGIGYFEHDGHVRGNEDVEIDLTSGQLNDVLKSLTALDFSGGRIVGASYNSQEPAGHQLESLPVPVADNTTLVSLLEDLRGARLEVRNSAGAFTGRLLSVEEKSRREGTAEVKFNQISLYGDSGEVRTFTLDSSTNFRFADRDLEMELSRALGLLDSSHQEDTRHLVLSTAGTGDRQIRVSYISEVPVWKTTYRIVMPGATSPEGTKPLLQGWAVVDNTVGEDWNDVELSLAAGAPQSFIQQLSQPYYMQRPTVGLPRGVLLSPQTHNGTLVPMNDGKQGLETKNSSMGETITGRSITNLPQSSRSAQMLGQMDPGAQTNGGPRNSTFEGLPKGAINVTFDGINAQCNLLKSSDGFFSINDSRIDDVEEFGVGTGGAVQMAYVSNANIAGAMERSTTAAQGGLLGDLFEYKLKDRVTIRKNQSALVPIVQTEIDAEKVALWNANLGMARPLRALWLKNSSDLVLDGGSFSVIEAGVFAGEGLIESIHPGEKRLISYAADLAMQVVAKSKLEPEELTQIRVTRGALIRTVQSRLKTTYTIRNEDSSARTLILEQPIRDGWKLTEDLKPEEESATAYRFRIEVKSKETKEFVVEETTPKVAAVKLDNLNETLIETFVSKQEITPELEKSLRQIIAQKDAIAKMDADLKQQQEELNGIGSDQSRVRENLQALKGTVEEKALAQRYVKELDEQETRLATLKKQIVDGQAKRKQAQQELDDTIEHFTFDGDGKKE
ncbi:MAG TPA: hypothetical protein VIH72_08785 [Candidatus Acidoferrales bacterium]